MPYCTVDEIKGEFKSMDFSATTNVKDTTVTGFITEADALINSFVGTKYQVPVTAAGEGLALLKLLSRSLVAARVKLIMEVVQQKSTDANQNVRSVLLSANQVMEILKRIQKGEQFLDGAVSLTGKSVFFNNNQANDVQPVAKKNERQW